MKRLGRIFIFVILVLTLVFLIACGETDPRKNYKTTKPSSTNNKNIFKLANYDTGNIAEFIAKKVFIYDDFSADITYEISGKTLEKDEDAEEQPTNYLSKENIIKAIDNYNEKQIYSADNNKLYKQGNRVLYLDEESIKEETIANGDNDETTNIVLEVYVTNLSYVCGSYKLMSLEDYIKTENKDLSNPLNKLYNFFNAKKENVRLIGEDALQGNFKVFVLGSSSYFPLANTEFIFEGNIIAYFNKADKISETEPKSITLSLPTGNSGYIAVMYQLAQPINWAILGPVVGVVSVFVILLIIKIILTKKRIAAKGR